MEKDGKVSKEGKLIKTTVNNASKITPGIDFKKHAHKPSGLKDDAYNIQHDKDVQMKVSNAATEKNPKSCC